MNNNLLIDQSTGELDWTFIKRAAVAFADKDYGGAAPTAWVRDKLNLLKDRAIVLRTQWRQDHGLPNDTEYEIMVVPAWGYSGDSFARA